LPFDASRAFTHASSRQRYCGTPLVRAAVAGGVSNSRAYGSALRNGVRSSLPRISYL
jgi:hypothetical protein